MEYNMDYKLRDSMLEFDPLFGDKENYDVAHFHDLDAETLEKMIELGFADPEETQNYSPSIAEFLQFMQSNSGFKAHGYVVSHERPDYRLTIEGLAGHATDFDDMQNFMYAFRQADEFTCEVGTQYAWYD